MSDQGSMNSGSTDAVATSAVESAEAQGYAAEPAVAAPASAARTKGERDEQMRRNLRDTFGSGPGKLALIAAAEPCCPRSDDPDSACGLRKLRG